MAISISNKNCYGPTGLVASDPDCKVGECEFDSHPAQILYSETDHSGLAVIYL